MKSIQEQTVLVSGASMAGLSTAYFMNKLGYKVTVVEIADAPRTAGGAVNIEDIAVDAARQMGILEELKANRLHVEMIEFKNADDITEGSMLVSSHNEETANEEIEIERDKFIHIVLAALKNDVEFIFNDRITALSETKNDIQVSFKNGSQRSFDLVVGCDGIHSGVRNTWFDNEAAYTHFLGAYFSITIINKLLIKEKTMQMYNVPGKVIMLNAYNNKTDIIFCFNADKEIFYNYRDEEQQRKIILQQFAGESWRTGELLTEVQQSDNFYFDKFCQVKMPSWTKGRVALVGDAAYCASPAAGKGASLAIGGAAALAGALLKHNGDFVPAFAEYNANLLPFIEEVQAGAALNMSRHFIPKTEEAIRKRNAQTELW